MPKASETGELHRHASQRSYAFHNNLHANAQSKSRTGPGHPRRGAKDGAPPKQHKGKVSSPSWIPSGRRSTTLPS